MSAWRTPDGPNHGKRWTMIAPGGRVYIIAATETGCTLTQIRSAGETVERRLLASYESFSDLSIAINQAKSDVDEQESLAIAYPEIGGAQ